MDIAFHGGMTRVLRCLRFQGPEDFALYNDLSLDCDVHLDLIGSVLSECGHSSIHAQVGVSILRALDRRNCLEHLVFDRKLDFRTFSPEEARLYLQYFKEKLGVHEPSG